jgi:hypothetical protein
LKVIFSFIYIYIYIDFYLCFIYDASRIMILILYVM